MCPGSFVPLAVAVVLLLAGPAAALSQAAPGHRAAATAPAGEEASAPRDSVPVIPLAGINVTVLRELRPVERTPAPVSVLYGDGLRWTLPGGPAEAMEVLDELPGVELEGVGGNQRRPVIRGLGGQRVLLLENGLRLNSARRRLASGAPPALAGLDAVDRIEVVRGPGSVLYGSDALGGVVNLVSRSTPLAAEDPVAGGALSVSHHGAGDGLRFSGALEGAAGPLGYRISASHRSSDSYTSPAGTFGRLTLDEPTSVLGTGVEDTNARAAFGVGVGDAGRIGLEVQGYRARNAGFGYVSPELLGEGLPTIDIAVPRQDFGRIRAEYAGELLDRALADRIEITAFVQDNERDFSTRVFAPMGPDAPPGAGVEIHSRNRSDLASLGTRLETRKLVADRVLLTYGAELHRETAENRDTATTRILGMGPPMVRGDGSSPVPDARRSSAAAFAQGRVDLGARTELVTGVRYERVSTEALDPEPGSELAGVRASDALVGSARALVEAGGGVTLVASVGRGFRAPNLVEQYYAGATPEGSGVWRTNPDLGPETSFNVDVGARVRRSRLTAELFVYRNVLSDGIRLERIGETEEGLALYRNENVGELRFRGVEAHASVRLPASLTLAGGYGIVACENPDDADDPVAEACGPRATGWLRHGEPAGAYWIEYALEWSGRRPDMLGGASPLGRAVPPYLIQDVRGGLRLTDGVRAVAAVKNLGDVLYARTMNAGFFRPEPGRSLSVGLTLAY